VGLFIAVRMHVLKQRLQADTVAAMRAQDKNRLSILRLIQAAIKQQEIDRRPTLAEGTDAASDDTQILELLDKMIRQRRDSIAQFTTAKRDDLVQKESFEIDVIQAFLPEPLDEAAIQALVQESIQATGAASIRDMGKVMALLKPQVQGRADMMVVGARVKHQLSS
jgi:uncharacterized protein YqeY